MPTAVQILAHPAAFRRHGAGSGRQARGLARAVVGTVRKPIVAKMTTMESPKPPAQDFWVIVCVLRTRDQSQVPDPWPVDSVGYIRNFGLRCHPDRLRTTVEREIASGNICWDETEWHRVDAQAVDTEIREQITPIDGEGAWYRSGRVFFSER